MTTVYSAPKELVPPKFDPSNITAYFRAQEAYVLKVKEWAKANGKGQYAGEEIRFPVADGYARYIVVSLSPVKLIHLATGDAYSFQYINRLTAQDIREKVAQNRSLQSIFSK